MVAAVLLVASCAAYEWRNPGLPEAQWPRDEAECVGWAAAKVEEEAARQERYGSGGGARVRDDRATTRESMMVRFEIKKRQARLVSICMKAKAYIKTESD